MKAHYLGHVVFYVKELKDKAKERVLKIYESIKELLDEKVIEKINNSPQISLIKENDNFFVITADITGYIQASGRVSRLYIGGLTKGLSLVLVDDEKAFNSLKKKARWFSDEIEFEEFQKDKLDEILKEIDEDRKRVKEALEGTFKESKDFFKSTFLIVESPNKAKTIASFYGKPIKRVIENIQIYEIATKQRILNITASKGHIFDLNKEEGFYGVKKEDKFVEIFELIDESKEAIIDVIKELDLENSEIFIATDPDIEGEKIGFDIYLNSKVFNKNIKRAEFHEVTKRAIDEALDKPREIDEDLVKAQLLRRVADRWIGFEISKYLQKEFNRKNLSAGRVQSAVLEWIVKREDEVKDKEYIVRVYIDSLDIDFIVDKSEQNSFYENIDKVLIKFEKIYSATLYKTPFSTDTMLFSASEELKFSPKYTMQLAQDLFEAGFITYHRTDSIRVSNVGINVAKEYIISKFSKEYFKLRSFKSKEGAHECIRPTKPMDAEELREYLSLNNQKNLTKNHLLLYDLIFKEFIASQMRECVVKKVDAKAIALGKSSKITFIKEIEKDGFNKILPIKVYDLEEKEYKIDKKTKIIKSKIPRYTFATLVAKMKEKGIGRPSTYAIIIHKLFERRYIFQKKGKIFATNLGKMVYEALKKDENIYKFVNEKYTKELEELLDKVEKKEADYQAILNELYMKIKKEIDENLI